MSRDPQIPPEGPGQFEPPKDEDDFSHYFNATSRLSRELAEAKSALLAEREARERAERKLAQLRDDEDSAGAECSRLECDQLNIHDALTDAGLPGAINAQNIIERIERLVAERDAAVARAVRRSS